MQQSDIKCVNTNIRRIFITHNRVFEIVYNFYNGTSNSDNNNKHSNFS